MHSDAFMARSEAGEAWPPAVCSSNNTAHSDMGCDFLHQGAECPFGCRPWREVCHHFAKKGNCKYGDMCRKIHSNPRQRPTAGSVPRRDRTPTRDRVPHPIQVALVALNLRSIDAENAESIRDVFKIRIKAIHPDRHATASRADLASYTLLTQELTGARDLLVEYLEHPSNWRGPRVPASPEEHGPSVISTRR